MQATAPKRPRGIKRSPTKELILPPKNVIWWGTDTETTGPDVHHGSKPFMVTSCSQEAEIRMWEWDVNPMTREPIIPDKELRSLRKHISSSYHVFHNTKFDVKMLAAVGAPVELGDRFHDTLVASHLISSNGSHGLKDLAMLFLEITDDDQQELREATIKSRVYGRRYGWRTAKAKDPHWPAIKKLSKSKSGDGDAWWVMDTWMPRAVAKHEEFPEDHPWWTVCAKYGKQDAERTIALHLIFQEILADRKLEWLYNERRKCLDALNKMETTGVSCNRRSLTKTHKEFKTKADDAEAKCFALADHKIDNLGSTQQLQNVLFGNFELTGRKKTKGGAWSTAREALEELRLELDDAEKPAQFIDALQETRGFAKAADYLESYSLFGIPVPPFHWYLFPSFNLTGTDTTRLSGNYPNMQNVSKQKGKNVRKCFGPRPKRMWFSIDYSNIEMRIFAYESGDKNLIKAFEEGGSVHLIFAKALHPTLFDECLRKGKSFKDEYESTWYQWVKNGNFALIYGAGVRKANLTYRVPGAYDLIRRRLPLIDKLMKSKNHEAKQTGKVITRGGYPLNVPGDRPHVAVNYFVQGTAGVIMVLAINRVYAYLNSVNAKILDPSKHFHMIMTIHDELVFDFPDTKQANTVIFEVAKIMASCGQYINIPTPVDVERHPKNWADGQRFKDGIWKSAA